jgi:hypothetical protein
MPHYNNPFRPRKYTYSNNTLLGNAPPKNHDVNVESLKTIDDIPLPNNIENPPDSLKLRQSKPSSPFLSFLKNRITIEEIILIGVIFILIQEGVEDEFLLLMLLYILIF